MEQAGGQYGFNHPSRLAMRLPAAVLKHLGEDGIAHVKYPAEAPLLDLAISIGTPIPSRPDGPLVEQIVPKASTEARKRSLSGIYGTKPFPFHTEAAYYRMPPRWAMLRLAAGSKSSTATAFVDGLAVARRPLFRASLRREIWVVAGKPGHLLSPIVSSTLVPRFDIVRWDEGCMRPGLPQFQETADTWKRALSAAEQEQVAWHPGEVVIWDNWRVLHSRSAVADDDVGTRILERCLVE